MMNKRYSNFVRPTPVADTNTRIIQPSFSGIEARRFYLEEIKEAGIPKFSRRHPKSESKVQHAHARRKIEDFSKKDLFLSVQNNDVTTLCNILDTCPDIINTIDDYGWSLLMIACQASSIDAVKELLKRGIDTNVRDKAGNSARSLVIKNRNHVLADILLSYKTNKQESVHKIVEKVKKPISKVKKSTLCAMCDKETPNKRKHLSSTVHNISVSKDKKIPANYVIPASNKGYQLMLKIGWDRESGLGPDGSGKKYPLKTVQKLDKKGLGLDKRKRKLQEEKPETVKQVTRKLLESECNYSKNMEINFRREFY